MVGFGRAGKGAGFMAEELGFEQAFGNRGAVHFLILAFPPVGQEV